MMTIFGPHCVQREASGSKPDGPAKERNEGETSTYLKFCSQRREDLKAEGSDLKSSKVSLWRRHGRGPATNLFASSPWQTCQLLVTQFVASCLLLKWYEDRGHRCHLIAQGPARQESRRKRSGGLTCLVLPGVCQLQVDREKRRYAKIAGVLATDSVRRLPGVQIAIASVIPQGSKKCPMQPFKQPLLKSETMCCRS